MKKLIWVSLVTALLSLGGCSATDDTAKADANETNKKSSTSKRRSADCGATTGTRLGGRC